uniref:Response regulatory domain-containing protein n=1 Tax=Kalmanozyma brasiliensis (strain GHG001) TaxID=1365824 RepID=V5EPP5_KALBG
MSNHQNWHDQQGPSGNPMDRAYGGMSGKQEDDMDDDDDFDGKGKGRGADGAQVANKGTSDFVKKLFSMLDDKAYESVVAWSPAGDSFIVKDMNDFTKHVLPRNFRHSNFASFVRQLNKYDFHKVKNPEDGSGAVGEHVWEFQHPDFVRGREDLLENVKRKIPAKKKPNAKGGLLDGDRDDSPSMAPPMLDVHSKLAESDGDLRMQVAHMTAVQEQMQNHILALTKQYQGVIGEMLTFQRNMVQQDQLMQNLIQYLMNLEQDRRVEIGPDQPSASSFMAQTGAHGGNPANSGSFLPPPGAQGSYDNASAGQFMNTMQHRAGDPSNSSNLQAASHSGGPSGPSAETGSNTTNTGSSTRMSNMTTAPSTVAPLSPKSVASPLDGNGAKTPEMSHQLSNPLSSMAMHPPDMGRRDSNFSSLRMYNGDNRNGSGAGPGGMPKLESRTTSYDSRDEGDATSQSASVDPTAGGASGSVAAKNRAKYLRTRRPTLVPGWTASPRVLLVDDDEVCRRLSSKFLQVFGCQIDYAVDGMSAVSKMNAEKYDLVLMDIIMPNLDGMSATSLIRQFDQSTPIISMTSNSGPSELMNYMSSGMTDMLPKPFTKEGLLEMLQKHLVHLKAAQREHRAASTDVGAPTIKRASSPLPPSSNVATGATPSMGEGDGVNPLAGMGFTDEEYVAMLQNLIAAGTGDDELAKALFGNDSFTPLNDTPGRVAEYGPSPGNGGGFNKRAPPSGEGGDGKRGRFDM